MKSKILGIQFRINPELAEREQVCIKRETDICVDVDYLAAVDPALDWGHPEKMMAGYSGVILGGSGDFDFDGNRAESDPARTTSYDFLERLRPLLTYLFEQDVPTLGICYGHQLLGAFAGAVVKYDEIQKKVCSHEVKLLVNKADYSLFADLPESFYAHYGHKDILDRVPEGAVLLINGGAKCQVSALRYKKNIFSTQFHPELNFKDMKERIKSSPDYLPAGTLAEEIFRDDPHSNTILRNFAKFVSLQTQSA